MAIWLIFRNSCKTFEQVRVIESLGYVFPPSIPLEGTQDPSFRDLTKN